MFEAVAGRRRPGVVVVGEESQRLRPVPTGRLRILAEQSRAEAVEGQGLVPGVAEVVMGGGGLPVEVGCLCGAVQVAVRFSRAVPRQCLPAAVAEAAVEDGRPLVGGEGVREVAGGLLGVAEGQQPVALLAEIAEGEGDIQCRLG